MISDLTSQIMVEGVIPAERKLSSIVKFYNGKGDSLSCRELKRSGSEGS